MTNTDTATTARKPSPAGLRTLAYLATQATPTAQWSGIKGLDLRTVGALLRTGLVKEVGDCPSCATWDGRIETTREWRANCAYGSPGWGCCNNVQITPAGLIALGLLSPNAVVDIEKARELAIAEDARWNATYEPGDMVMVDLGDDRGGVSGVVFSVTDGVYGVRSPYPGLTTVWAREARDLRPLTDAERTKVEQDVQALAETAGPATTTITSSGAEQIEAWYARHGIESLRNGTLRGELDFALTVGTAILRDWDDAIEENADIEQMRQLYRWVARHDPSLSFGAAILRDWDDAIERDANDAWVRQWSQWIARHDPFPGVIDAILTDWDDAIKENDKPAAKTLTDLADGVRATFHRHFSNGHATACGNGVPTSGDQCTVAPSKVTCPRCQAEIWKPRGSAAGHSPDA